jgi:alkylation response protein AidB-like acyl-CoA dehydrogenase
MYDFALSPESELIRAAAAQFAAERLRPAGRPSEDAGELDSGLVAQSSEAGFAALELHESLDGLGLGPVDKAIVFEALAFGDAPLALALDGLGPALYPLTEMGGGRGLELVAGQRRVGMRGWVVIDDEGASFSIEGDRIRGTWPWVPANALDLLVVLRGDEAFVVTEGIALTPIKTCAGRAAGAAELSVDGKIVERFESMQGGRRARARLRIYASSMLVGIADAALQYAITYTQERVAFGRPIAHHQGVAFLVAELATQLDGARLSLWQAAWALGEEGDPTGAAAHAFMDAIDAALACGEQGVQLLGGHGYMQDHPSEKWMREARTFSQLWGGRDAALDDLAERVMETSAKVGFAVPGWPAPEGA